ncbi:hypothetical protein, partial [Jhaorihella thermophila]|uniref:hypothetical protein n=1 Tax=Jhaorihella thermophila TaxID=488547 RepID=UPI001F158082
MTGALERPKSRPRAIFLDLTSPVLPSCPVPEMPWPYKADRDAERYEDILCRLALATGLPVVAFVPDKVKWSQKIGQRAKVYPKPIGGIRDGETPEVHRS